LRPWPTKKGRVAPGSTSTSSNIRGGRVGRGWSREGRATVRVLATYSSARAACQGCGRHLQSLLTFSPMRYGKMMVSNLTVNEHGQKRFLVLLRASSVEGPLVNAYSRFKTAP
jgi:hypothetical protein